jgi:hypothetical protein
VLLLRFANASSISRSYIQLLQHEKSVQRYCSFVLPSCSGYRVSGSKNISETQQFHTALLLLGTSSFSSTCTAAFRPPPFFPSFFVRWTPDHLIKMSSWIFEYCPVLPYPNQDAEPSGTGTSISDLMTGYAEFRRYQCSNCLGVRLRSSK